MLHRLAISTALLPLLLSIALAPQPHALPASHASAPPQDERTDTPAYPPSDPLAEGVSPAGLARLNELIQGLVDADEVVGAELLIIKNGRTIQHAAFGYSDREAELPLEPGSLFCVRSMTKPVIGTAVLMLADDGRIRLKDPVAKHLPAFDADGFRDVTIEQLLQHTSGLPMSYLMGKDLQAIESIQAVAELSTSRPLGSVPGSAFTYSDQGADTLTALVEVVSEMSAAEFVQTRLLDPLGMRSSACVLTLEHPLRGLAVTKYAGSRQSWKPFWSPADPPLFPFFLGSQGLYSTTADYARFLEFWMRRGRSPEKRLLGARYVRKALTPGPYALGAGTALPGVRSEYGYLMQLWTERTEAGPSTASEKPSLVAFGHSGSDGTYAWAFPEAKAMVLYFTQSRGNTTGLQVEELLGSLFLGAPYDPNEESPPLDPYLGYYYEGEGDVYRAIVLDGDDLALEILGRGVVPLDYAGGERWKFRPNPSNVIAFDRGPDGSVSGYHIGDHQEFRLVPSPDLPTAQDLAARVRAAHRLDLLESAGPLRMTGTIEVEVAGLTGSTSETLAWPGRYRFEATTPQSFEVQTLHDGHAFAASTLRAAAELTGDAAHWARTASPLARFGSWADWYPLLEVIQELRGPNGESVFLVRTGDARAPARTLYVHGESGRVFREDGMTYADTLGRIGLRIEFDDFRDVGGMLLPFETRTTFPHPLIGTVVTTVTESALGVEVEASAFVLAD